MSTSLLRLQNGETPALACGVPKLQIHLLSASLFSHQSNGRRWRLIAVSPGTTNYCTAVGMHPQSRHVRMLLVYTRLRNSFHSRCCAGPATRPGGTQCLSVDTAWPLLKDCPPSNTSDTHQVIQSAEVVLLLQHCSYFAGAPKSQLLCYSRVPNSVLCSSSTTRASSSRTSWARHHAAEAKTTETVASCQKPTLGQHTHFI